MLLFCAKVSKKCLTAKEKCHVMSYFLLFNDCLQNYQSQNGVSSNPCDDMPGIALAFSNPCDDMPGIALAFSNPCDGMPVIALAFSNPCDDMPAIALTFSNPCDDMPAIALTFSNPCDDVPAIALTFSNPCDDMPQFFGTFSLCSHRAWLCAKIVTKAWQSGGGNGGCRDSLHCSSTRSVQA